MQVDLPQLGQLDTRARLAALGTQWLGCDYHYMAVVDSTNRWLSERAEALDGDEPPTGALVLADQQTKGRGRRGRSWISPPEQNLYFSFLLRPRCNPSSLPPLSLAAAVAIARGLTPHLGAAPVVKWPNDLLWRRKKLAGILVEVASSERQLRHVVVGVGINVNQAEFAPEIAALATSVRLATGREVVRHEVLGSVLAAFEQCLEQVLAGTTEPMLDAWMGLADWIGRSLTVNTVSGSIHGEALGVDADGALRLRLADGTVERVLAGDVDMNG